MLNGRKLYDISMTINEGMQVYKNKEEKKPELRNMSNHRTGSVYETRIGIDAHCGTHLDAPLHMLDGGATIDTIPLERLVSSAQVVDLTHVSGGISRSDLEALDIGDSEWLLLKTRNSFSEQFDFEFIYLTADGAQYVIEKGIRGVGTDGLGIERSQPEYPTHRSLMRSGVLILEGLRLKDVHPGVYDFVLAPLKLEGIEAAPARAFLIG
ncbi:cyclase family protein [Paenibacillus alkalitolerans]|uniref:cyclase family protein n=1 Tax=Paenibacillus alkalitolerans TaxID=2799335 RepID=UPI0018F7964A|nr:cyclase family protein [Paenibacillus alkalitolerans]